MTPKGKAMESLSRIEPLILTIRGTKVILDGHIENVACLGGFCSGFAKRLAA